MNGFECDVQQIMYSDARSLRSTSKKSKFKYSNDFVCWTLWLYIAAAHECKMCIKMYIFVYFAVVIGLHRSVRSYENFGSSYSNITISLHRHTTFHNFWKYNEQIKWTMGKKTKKKNNRVIQHTVALSKNFIALPTSAYLERNEEISYHRRCRADKHTRTHKVMVALVLFLSSFDIARLNILCKKVCRCNEIIIIKEKWTEQQFKIEILAQKPKDWILWGDFL